PPAWPVAALPRFYRCARASGACAPSGGAGPGTHGSGSFSGRLPTRKRLRRLLRRSATSVSSVHSCSNLRPPRLRVTVPRLWFLLDGRTDRRNRDNGGIEL